MTPPDTAPDAEALAERINAAKLATLGMLIAGIAHEINTPLGAIHSNHDVLRRAIERLQGILADEYVDETELDEVRRIVRTLHDVIRVNTLAVERMTQIAGSLRTFGRLDRAQIDHQDLHEGLDSALDLLAHQTRGRIEVVRDYGTLPRVQCYPQQLNQLFMNLLLNAVQAIRGPGTLTVRTRTPDEAWVEVEVEDTGVGIETEVVPRVFEPGFTTKGARVGMGMGLLICRQIAEQHGGRIQVRSRVGQGSVFTVRLPVRMRAAPVADGNPVGDPSGR
jgi:two-component system, NtrC family, sensor kinase